MRLLFPLFLACACSAAGKTTTVNGTARNAKLGAVIETSDRVVYCLGLDSWPAHRSGQPVTAHGRLEQTDDFSASSGAEISAGTDGLVWVLRDCRYDDH